MTDTAQASRRPAVAGVPLDLWYALGLFAAAMAAIAHGISLQGGVLAGHGPGVAAFFLVFGLFTISVGYPHPHFGYYSFDRVSQVASILVLGPVDAAWVNGLASLLYPVHRLVKGVPASDVLVASVNNSGLMALMIFVAGSVYVALGGQVPLESMNWRTIGALLVLVIAMQALNDLGMLGALVTSGERVKSFFSPFSMTVELGSAATAIVVALVFNRMEVAAFALLLGVLTLGMLAIRQLAHMRDRLERRVAERTQALHAKTIALEKQATQDTLTGLYNRRYADDFVERELERCADDAVPFVIALADIDFFKQINDSYSHATGDEVLRRVAAVLRGRCRRTDVVARYGGEEFLLCFPDTELAEAQGLCETLRKAVQLEDWAALGLRGEVTLSVGLAACEPSMDHDTLLRAADRQLYAAKRKGRNRVVA